MSEFLALPLWGQTLVASMYVLIGFVVHTKLKGAYGHARRSGRTWKILLIGVPYHISIPLFGFADFALNCSYMTLFFWRLPNAHKEGWLVSHRVRWYKRQVELKRSVGGKALSLNERKALAICKVLEIIDEGHCGGTA